MTRVSSILFWFGLTFIVSLGLYGTSNRVQDLSKQLLSLNAQIEAEQANIHVLKAEWVYLSNPQRIEQAARKYLAMHPTALEQIAKLDDLPEILPTQKEAMAGVTVRGKPMANLGSTLTKRRATASVPTSKTSAKEEVGHVNTRMTLQSAANDTIEEEWNEEAAYGDSQMMMADTMPLTPSGPAP